MPQHITLREVAAKARAAHRAGTLAAFAGADWCRYSYSEDPAWRCAIGAALTQETLEAITKRALQEEDVATLVSAGIITAPEDEIGDLLVVQLAHDAVVHGEPISRDMRDGEEASHPQRAPRHPAARAFYERHRGQPVTGKDFLRLLDELAPPEPAAA